MDTKGKIIYLFEHLYGRPPESMVWLPQAGGDRRYCRMQLPARYREETGEPATHVMGVAADNTADAEAFISLARTFRSYGVPVPKVWGYTDDRSCYIEEDLGDDSLFNHLGDADAEQLVRQTLTSLVRMQTVPQEEWIYDAAYQSFSKRQVMWDLNYFKYEFLKNSGVDFDEESLENDFDKLASRLLSVPQGCTGFMMRDCQSRNVMIRHDSDGAAVPVFIDFQGGRLGPVLYDAVSLLWQAKACFSDEFRQRMLAHYASEYEAATGVKPGMLLGAKNDMVLFRTLQVLGAYGYRGLVQKRAHFVESIPGAIANLAALRESDALDEYEEIKEISRKLSDSARFQKKDTDGKLHVKVFSFSYKKGYPEDLSGNGGGFMFDCRGMHNPGRYEQYKQLTGLDQPVIDFLKQCGEIDGFVDKAYDMVAPTVARYIKRGFSSLQIGFGCTGGRHRSVYSAQAMAEKLAREYPEAVVELHHREQDLHQTYNN